MMPSLRPSARTSQANGLQSPIICQDTPGAELILLDGRNRLEAMERVGISDGQVDTIFVKGDPIAVVISANVQRRHLTKQQQADLIVAAHQALKVSRQVGGKLAGGRPVNQVKAAAIASAKAMPDGPSKRTVERAFEQATEHPNAPPRLRAKARRQRKRETLQAYHQLLATLPRTVEGARRFYVEVVARHVVDLNAELEAVVDALQRLQERRPRT